MQDRLSLKEYNLVIGLILLWGLLVNVLTCAFCGDFFATINQGVFLIGYFIVATIGICMSVFSDKPIISFVGYNFVVLPMGAMLSVLLRDIESDIILRTFVITFCVTGIMIIASTLKPDVFLSMGRTLFICLIAVVVIEFVMIITGVGTQSWWDFIVALLFCGYIGYDWSKAQAIPKTLDNAVDSVVDLYLDIVNVFIRLLDIMDD